MTNIKNMTRTTQSIIKYCQKHGDNEFVIVSTTGKTYCRKCKSEQCKNRRYSVKLKCIEYLGGKCAICGYSGCQASLVFHKRIKDNNENIEEILQHTWENIKPHLDNCILLCGNCHIKVQSGIINIDTGAGLV